MNAQTPALRTRGIPVPRRTSPWVLLGPGIVLLGMSQGSGEIWLLPKLHAEHGLAFTWVILYGSLLQVPILVEAMRTTALTGESPLSVLARVSKPAATVCLLLTAFAMIGAAGFILTVGESLWRLAGWPNYTGGPAAPKKLWAIIVALAFGIPVLLKRTNVQRYMEYVVGACSVASLGIFLAVLFLRGDVLDRVPVFVAALILPQGLLDIPSLSVQERTTVAVGFTYMGLGGWYCLFYPLWGRHRGVGIAGAPAVEGNGTAPPMAVAGNDAEDAKRIHDWIRSIWFGTTGAIAANGLTVCLTSLLAFGLLHQRGATIGSNWDIVTQQAAFFEPVFGTLAPTLFMVAVTAFFLDTWLATYGSLAQLLSETLPHLSQRLAQIGEGRLFRPVFVLLVGLSLSPLLGSLSPGALLLRWMGVVMFCSMPIIGAMLYYVNYRLLPRIGPEYYMPSRGAKGVLVATTIIYLVATVVYIAGVMA